MIITSNERLGIGNGKPFETARIGNVFWLLWLEHVITEASLMTRSIKLHSMLMNLMCFPLQTHPTVTLNPPRPPQKWGGSDLLTKNMT